MAPRHRLGFAAASVAVAVGFVLWMALDTSWPVFALGAVTTGAFAWVWGLRLALSRSPGAGRLVLTGESLATPPYSLDWDRVAALWIGATHPLTGSLAALFVEPSRPADVRWSSSYARADARLSRMRRTGGLCILQVNVDRPLEELVGEFEERAGRPLLARSGREA